MRSIKETFADGGEAIYDGIYAFAVGNDGMLMSFCIAWEKCFNREEANL